ncbi:hypothetical protein K438DRAFT_1976561 [Mycena galopus ATCC 62051]|nr:hypothetical protein K438DRAFT_1976561 [Mycena galopus ATCC 62051]
MSIIQILPLAFRPHRHGAQHPGPCTAHLASHEADPFSAASPPHDSTPTTGPSSLGKYHEQEFPSFSSSVPDLDPGLTHSRPSAKALGKRRRIEHDACLTVDSLLPPLTLCS